METLFSIEIWIESFKVSNAWTPSQILEWEEGGGGGGVQS